MQGDLGGKRKKGEKKMRVGQRGGSLQPHPRAHSARPPTPHSVYVLTLFCGKPQKQFYMETKNKERCTCGQVAPVYYPDENQYEPGCWDCYYQAKEAEHQFLEEDRAAIEADIEACWKDYTPECDATPEEVLLIEAEEHELREAIEAYEESQADYWISCIENASPE